MWGLRPVQTRAAGAGQCGTAGGHFGHGPILTMAPAPGIRTVVGWVVGMLVSFFERGRIDACQGCQWTPRRRRKNRRELSGERGGVITPPRLEAACAQGLCGPTRLR